MPRHYIRKTNRGFTAELIKAAADEVINENKSVRSTAKKYDLCHVSLSQYVAKFKTSINNGDVSTLNVGYKGPKQVFSVHQEQILSQYIKNSTILNQIMTDNPIPSTISNVISPESIRPYPKAVREQKLNKKCRQKGKSACVD